jgi:hypothetical protein
MKKVTHKDWTRATKEAFNAWRDKRRAAGFADNADAGGAFPDPTDEELFQRIAFYLPRKLTDALTWHSN